MKKLFMISNLFVSLLVITLSGCTTISPDSIIYSPNPITNFVWVGMDADKVGRYGPDEGRPNGEQDGHFRLNLNLDRPTEIMYVALYLSTPDGMPIGGVVWHTYPPQWWVLGVFHQNKQLNFNHVTSLGRFSGPNEFDLYANDSGHFQRGNFFYTEVKLEDGRTFKKILQLN